MATVVADADGRGSGLVALEVAYGSGVNLDAKWDVMRRCRTADTAFEPWLLDLIDLPAGARVLDVGAGSGRFALPTARHLLRTGGSVVACDLLPEVMSPIRRAVQSEHLPIECVTADARDIPASLGEFDVVLAAHMLYHLPDITAAAEGLRARLNPGGLFVATTNAADGMPELFELHAAALEALGLPAPRPSEPGSFTLESGAELLRPVFDEVRTAVYDGSFTATTAEPVFSCYAATELYRSQLRDESLPEEARFRIAPTFVRLAQTRIDADGPVRVRKDVGAFLCR